jgi:ABC-type multidrug transport system ATPase subunit
VLGSTWTVGLALPPYLTVPGGRQPGGRPPSAARRTEQAIAATIRGRTIIAVAHRLQTARDADRIAVMEDGRITELGRHNELIATKTSYAALWRAWNGATTQNQANDQG